MDPQTRGKIISQTLLIIVTLLITSCLGTAQNAALAGWAEVDITPPLGIALGGRGGSYTAAKQVLDPLSAQILYLKDQKGVGLVFVSFDLVGLPHALSDRIRQSIVHELGIDWDMVILNCSHTHSGPNMLRDLLAGVGPATQLEDEYFASLQEKVVIAAREAKKKLSRVSKIETFEGKSLVAINRRGKNKTGGRGIIPDPEGPIDEKVWVLRVLPEGNKPGAIVFSYACHPVIVYGYAGAAISAEFPGVARKTLRESLPEVEHVQYLQGFAGNVRPRAVADLNAKAFRGGNPGKLNQAGTDLARDVLTALKTKGEPLKLDIAGASDRPFLPRGEPPSRDVYEKMAQDKNEYHKNVGEYWLKRYDSGEGFARGDAWPTGLIRLAKNQWIVYLGGEPVVEWRNKISKWLAPRKLVTIGYAPEANTYLPTEELLPEGGYEVLECNRARASSPAPFAPGIHDAVRESLLRQLSFIEARVK